MIESYKRLGHGTNFVGAWTEGAFFLAAVFFVDDSDLLNMAEETSTNDSYLKIVQEAPLDWEGLTQASRGSIKPSKHFQVANRSSQNSAA